MYKLTYLSKANNNHFTCPDFLAEEEALMLGWSDVTTSNETVVLAALALIAEGKLNINEIEFYCDDIKVTVQDGKIINAPKGFGGSYGVNFCERIIGGQNG